MKIPLYDRARKRCIEEPVYGSAFLRALYPSSRLSQLLAWPFLQLICRLPWISALYGWLQRSPVSKKKITPFIQNYGVCEEEFQETNFTSFDAFFTRHLKKEARPIGEGIIAPADGRYRFISDIGKEDFFYAKGQRLNLNELLGPYEVERFEGGSLVIARLAPPDYHRFHYPASGKAKTPQLIEGPLFSVNPRSLQQKISHLISNKRFITELEGAFGTMLFIEIGATFVGSIHHTKSGWVEKGEEKGFFSFGASAVLLLFEPGKIVFEPDLFEGPKELEVRCLMGQPIAQVL